mgnify:CR=1 FL=1
MFASSNGHNHVARALIGAKAAVDVQDNRGDTALKIAAFDGHHLIVETLLEAGANVDICDHDNWTALMVSAQNGHTQVRNSLKYSVLALCWSAQPNCRSHLFLCHLEQVVRELLEAGASQDAKSKGGLTAYAIAKDGKHISICSLLQC